MHVRITATRCESVRDNIKKRIGSEKEEGGSSSFFLRVERRRRWALQEARRDGCVT